MVEYKEGMMECLALAPLKLIIWSSDKTLVHTNIFVNAHPKATTGYLLQYIHSQIKAEQAAIGQGKSGERGVLCEVSEYCLYYRSLNELRLDSLLQDLEPEANNMFIRLQLEQKRSFGGESINLDSDFNEDLKTVNLQFNINALSIDKIMSRMEFNIPMSINIAGLKKIALKHLFEYETGNNTKNLCHLKGDHSTSDIIAFIIKGEQSPIYLNDPNVELYDDLTLGKVLGFDFPPQKHSYFTLMFKVRHGQSSEGDMEDSISIEFVSDSKLSINTMSITADTTVEEVKEFICSTYTHSLRLQTNDVKLIYKGQLVHTLDFAGQPSKMMEYINGSEGAKIHVHINQEYNEPGPGFWSELFNSPDRFEFLPQATLEAQSMLPTFSSQSRTASIPVSSLEKKPKLMKVDNYQRQYVTESGLPCQLDHETYLRCLVEGKKEVFVPSHVLEPREIKLQIENDSIPVSSLDFIIENGIVKLSPHLVSRIESKFDIEVVKSTAVDIEETSGNVFGIAGQSIFSQGQLAGNQRSFSVTVFPLMLLVFKTIYLIANNSIVPFFFVLELSTILSWKYTALVAAMFLIRTIWSTREIWEIWSDYFSSSELTNERYMEIKEYINCKSLSKEFYIECTLNTAVTDILMSSNFRVSRQRLYQAFNNNNSNETDDLATLTSLMEKLAAGEIEKEPIDDFIISCLDIYDTSRDTIPISYQDSMRKLLILARRDMKRSIAPESLPLYKKFLIKVKRAMDRARQSQISTIILEHVVPDPRHDTIPVAILKNLTLFFLVMIPPIKNKVDTILEERARVEEQQHTAAEQENEQFAQHTDLHPIPEQVPFATGLEQYQQDIFPVHD